MPDEQKLDEEYFRTLITLRTDQLRKAAGMIFTTVAGLEELKNHLKARGLSEELLAIDAILSKLPEWPHVDPTNQHQVAADAEGSRFLEPRGHS